jgi:hypothetical protein
MIDRSRGKTEQISELMMKARMTLKALTKRDSVALSTGHLAARADLRHPNNRAGRKSTVRTRENRALTEIPTSRSGNDKSHTTGNRISASSASGQQSTNKMHQPRNRSSVFIAQTQSIASAFAANGIRH